MKWKPRHLKGIVVVEWGTWNWELEGEGNRNFDSSLQEQIVPHKNKLGNEVDGSEEKSTSLLCWTIRPYSKLLAYFQLKPEWWPWPGSEVQWSTEKLMDHSPLCCFQQTTSRLLLYFISCVFLLLYTNGTWLHQVYIQQERWWPLHMHFSTIQKQHKSIWRMREEVANFIQCSNWTVSHTKIWCWGTCQQLAGHLCCHMFCWPGFIFCVLTKSNISNDFPQNNRC